MSQEHFRILIDEGYHTVDELESMKIEDYKTEKVLVTYRVFYTDT